jgi:hypothetical protein
MSYILYVKMADEFDFFSYDCNDWNYNPFMKHTKRRPVQFKKDYKSIERERERERERDRETERARAGEGDIQREDRD